MKLTNKQKYILEKLEQGWIVKVMLIQNAASKTWLYKDGNIPISISYLSVASLKIKQYLKQIPANRHDERWYVYSTAGITEEQKRKELVGLGIPSFAF